MKPHIKVIQRNGVDIFVTSSMVMKPDKLTSNSQHQGMAALANTIAMGNFAGAGSAYRYLPTGYDQRQTSGIFHSYGNHIYQG